MEIGFDPARRVLTLAERGLDLMDAAEVFAGPHNVAPDVRKDNSEPRFITAGLLRGRVVVLVWTPRGAARRIISMRHAHEREAAQWRASLG